MASRDLEDIPDEHKDQPDDTYRDREEEEHGGALGHSLDELPQEGQPAGQEDENHCDRQDQRGPDREQVGGGFIFDREAVKDVHAVCQTGCDQGAASGDKGLQEPLLWQDEADDHRQDQHDDRFKKVGRQGICQAGNDFTELQVEQPAGELPEEPDKRPGVYKDHTDGVHGKDLFYFGNAFKQ